MGRGRRVPQRGGRLVAAQALWSSEFPRIVCTGSLVSEKHPSRILGEERQATISGSRPKHPVEKAKIVHLAHVLGFARVHYLAVERQPAGDSGRERRHDHDH
jgi:hypothetical protein